jgi:GDPmannose 4,6-dehydratase
MTTKKRALITGITGQDGGHLAELLHEKGYEIYGIIRGQHNPKREITEAEFPYVTLIEADLMDPSSLVRAMQISQPDEVYNLAAISHVGYSFKNPQLTAEATGVGVLNLLEAIRLVDTENKVRFYQASTSEMYGGLEYNRP